MQSVSMVKNSMVVNLWDMHGDLIPSFLLLAGPVLQSSIPRSYGSLVICNNLFVNLFYFNIFHNFPSFFFCTRTSPQGFCHRPHCWKKSGGPLPLLLWCSIPVLGNFFLRTMDSMERVTTVWGLQRYIPLIKVVLSHVTADLLCIKIQTGESRWLGIWTDSSILFMSSSSLSWILALRDKYI